MLPSSLLSAFSPRKTLLFTQYFALHVNINKVSLLLCCYTRFALHSLNTYCSNFQIGVLLFFCIISVLLGLALVVIYGFFIVILWNIAHYIPVHIAIALMFATLGITEIVTGIWSAVCCCRSCCAVAPSDLVSPPSEALFNKRAQCVDL